jgi:glutaredoxin-like YruB-family protein
MNTKKIIIYSTPTCHYCTMAKNYFTKMGVQYEDINVGIDRAAAQEMIMKSGQMGVPVIDIDGQIIVGFQPEVFQKLINSK